MFGVYQQWGRWSCCFLCMSPRVIDTCSVQLEIMSFFTWVSSPAWTSPIQMRCSSASRGPAENQKKWRQESNPCLKKYFVFCCAFFLFVYQAPCGLDGSVAGTRASGSVHGCWCHKLESRQQQEGIREFFLSSKCRLQSLERKAWDLMGRKHSSPHTGRPDRRQSSVYAEYLFGKYWWCDVIS